MGWTWLSNRSCKGLLRSLRPSEYRRNRPSINSTSTSSPSSIAARTWVTQFLPFELLKNLHSLPPRFKIQVTILEGKRKLKEKFVQEIAGILQTYEADLLQSEPVKPRVKHSETPIAFKNTKKLRKVQIVVVMSILRR